MTQKSLQVAKIVGNTNETGWSQVHTFFPEDLEKQLSRGQLLVAISLSGRLGIEIVELGKEILTRFHEEYYGMLNSSPFVGLKLALEKITNEFGHNANLQIVAGAYVKQILYLATNGNGQVLLARQGRTARILHGQKNIIKTASGYLIPGDLLLLGSAELICLIDEQILKETLLARSPEAVAEILSPHIHAKENNSLAAAVIVQLPIEEKVKKPGDNWFATQTQESGRERQIRKHRQMIRSVVVLLLFLLATSLFFGFSKNNNAANREIKEILVEAPACEYDAEARLFFDLGLIKNNAQLTSATIVDDVLLVLDQPQKAVYKIRLSDKNSSIVAGGKEVSQSYLIAADKTALYLLGEEGVWQQKVDEKNLAQVVSGGIEKGASLFTAFGNNLYLAGKNNLWVYQRDGEIFKAARQWFNEADLPSKVLSMAIDGSVWLVDGENQLVKYAQGERVVLSLSPVNPPLAHAAAIYTSEEIDNIYILDKENARIIVFKKTGEYDCQYRSSGVPEANNLLVSPNSGKMLLLGESKIYEILLH